MIVRRLELSDISFDYCHSQNRSWCQIGSRIALVTTSKLIDFEIFFRETNSPMNTLWDQTQLHFHNFFSDPQVALQVRMLWQQENLPAIHTPRLMDHFVTYTGHRWLFVDLLIRHGIVVPGVNMEALRDSVVALRAPSAAQPRIQFVPSSESTRYVELKMTLSQHLLESQWKAMAELLAVPAGTASNFHTAGDLFRWMENSILPGDNRPCLAKQRLGKLHELLELVGATACAQLVDSERFDLIMETVPNESAQYTELKLRLSEQLTRDQWERMAHLVGVPPGLIQRFRNATDLFNWMETITLTGDSRPCLSEQRLDKLKELLGHRLVGAAACLPLVYNMTGSSVHISVASLPPPAPVRVPAPAPAPAPSRFPVNWQQEPIRLVGDNDVGGCQICCEYRADAMSQPCNHLCMCMRCAERVLGNANTVCPICRQTVSHVLGVRLAS